jgi:hypothetical protein
MIYYTETMIDTTSTSHFRTFLKPGSKYYVGAKGVGAKGDTSGSIASRAPA